MLILASVLAGVVVCGLGWRALRTLWSSGESARTPEVVVGAAETPSEDATLEALRARCARDEASAEAAARRDAERRQRDLQACERDRSECDRGCDGLGGSGAFSAAAQCQQDCAVRFVCSGASTSWAAEGTTQRVVCDCEQLRCYDACLSRPAQTPALCRDACMSMPCG